MKKWFGLLLLSSCSLSAFCQDETKSKEAGANAEARSPWRLGVAAIVSDSPYAGERSRVIPVPMLSYEGERFYFRGVSAGYRWLSNDAISLDLLAKYRFAAFEVDELGSSELAANGIDQRQLEDRDGGIDLGLSMTWTGDAGALDVELLTDASDSSGGQEATLTYRYPIPVGYGRLSPSAGITWMSADLADYHYGTLASEVARGVVSYRPGASTLPKLGLSFSHPLSRQWFFVGALQYAALPSKIRRSPLIETGVDGETSLFLSVTRGL